MNLDELIVLTHEGQSEADGSVAKLAEWMGLRTLMLPSSLKRGEDDVLLGLLPSRGAGLAISADTLAHLLGPDGDSQTWLRLLAEKGVCCLVYGFQLNADHSQLYGRMTGSPTARMEPLSQSSPRCRFGSEKKDLLHQLSGIEFDGHGRGLCAAFSENFDEMTGKIVPLLTVCERPVFVFLERGGAELFLWATNVVGDVTSPPIRGTELEHYYEAILPAIIFLKRCFGDRCWHNSRPCARLVIDDPLLRDRYGFLEYEKLLDSTQRLAYGATIAFIPWNYRRSRRSVSSTLVGGSDSRLSVCVHGCDHTNHEFATSDDNTLTFKSRLALYRMEEHQQRTGVVYEKVMVFPQGQFSVASMRALRASGFLAVVNSTSHPIDVKGDCLTLGELMRPAVNRFHGMAIFARHYPGRLIDFAVDIFLGKAAIAVEHHEFFRNGYGQCENLVKQLQALDAHLSWPTLTVLTSQCCMKRRTEDDCLEIRFFTRRFRWHSDQGSTCLVRFSKVEPVPELVEEVRVDGRSLPVKFSDGFLEFELVTQSGQTISVEVVDRPVKWQSCRPPGWQYNCGVFTRRCLSELRDDWLSRSPGLLAGARRIAHLLKATGNSRNGGRH